MKAVVAVWVSACAVFLALGVLHGCGEGESVAPAAIGTAGRAPAKPAVAGLKVSAPFDLSGIIRQVHFAYRPDGAEWEGGGDAFSVRVSARGAFAVTPRDGRRTGVSATFETVGVHRGGADLGGAPFHMDNPDDGGLAMWRNPASPVIERLVNSDAGVEQSWRFEERPDGAGDLIMRVRVTGQEFAGETEEGFHFSDAKTGLGLRYGHATWIDAEGARIDVPATWTGTEIALVVPEAVLESSAFPATLDPIISPEIPMGDPVWGFSPYRENRPAAACDGTNCLVAWRNWGLDNVFGTFVTRAGTVVTPAAFQIASENGFQVDPAVSFDGTNYLVVWVDSRNGGNRVYGARVDKNGTVLDPHGFEIDGGGHDSRPAVCFGGGYYLIVWTYDTHYVHGVRVAAAGTVVGSVIEVADAGGQVYDPDVAFDGTNYIAVWRDGRTAGNSYDIYGARITTAGVVLDPAGIAIYQSTNTEYDPSVAFDGTNYLVAWDGADMRATRVSPYGAVLDPAGILITTTNHGGFGPDFAFDGTNYLLVWVDDRNPASKHDIYGARVGPSGTVLDPSGIAINTAAGDQWEPAVAFDGEDFLVVWANAVPEGGSYYHEVLYGARVSSAGTVLDPDGFLVGSTANQQRRPAAAFNGTNYLAAWSDLRPGIRTDIYGARFTPDGTLLDPAGIAVCDAPGDQINPAVASDGSDYLVVWDDFRDDVDIAKSYGARIAAGGTVLDPEAILIAGSPNHHVGTRAAFDGANYLVAWEDRPRGADVCDVYGARVSTSGGLLDPSGFAISTAAGAQLSPAIASGGGTALVVWHDSRSGTSRDIYGARVTPTGTVLDPDGIPIETGAYDQRFPDAAFDGSNFLVVWDSALADGTRDIRGRRVSPAGAPLDPAGIAIATTATSEAAPGVAFDGQASLVAWQANTNILATRVDPAGAILDPALSVAGEPYAEYGPEVASAGVGKFLVLYTAAKPDYAYVERVFGRTVVWTPPGTPCAEDMDCENGQCEDGVCCQTDCGDSDPTDCRACDLPGYVGTCTPLSEGDVCRAASGDCDVAEACDGESIDCPADGFQPDAFECRASAGVCDVAENCTGASATCPADALRPSGYGCRISAGFCDVAEYCTGSAVDCPPDGFRPDTFECRAAAGDCDMAENCTGASATCPADAFYPSGHECRAAAGICDAAEACDGSSIDCPADGYVPDDTECPDGLFCNGEDACQGGNCVHAGNPCEGIGACDEETDSCHPADDDTGDDTGPDDDSATDDDSAADDDAGPGDDSDDDGNGCGCEG